MTEEERLSIKRFEARVRTLIAEFSALKQENEKLTETIKDKDATIADLNNQLVQSKNDYDNLKLAKMISISDNDKKAAKQTITKLVRDVNKCISMLSSDYSEENSNEEISESEA